MTMRKKMPSAMYVSLLSRYGNILSFGFFRVFLRFFREVVRVAFAYDFTRLCTVCGAYDAAFLQHVDKFCRACIADAKFALEIRGRGFARFYHRALRIRVELVVLALVFD